MEKLTTFAKRLGLAGLGAVTLGVVYNREDLQNRNKNTVSVIPLQGLIMAGRQGLSQGDKMNLDNTRKMIDDAFKQKNLQLVCLNVNSPGGSPVQSDLIGQYIKDKSEKHKVPVIVFVEDTAASGGYWLACAGQQIYAARSSVVGSIGVISGSLGFHELIKKYGIERRVFTAGTNKSVLDPLSPLKESDVEIIKNLLASIHNHFIDHVKASRGDRLKADDETLFNGEFWTGDKALELGLIDGIDTLDAYIRRKYGDEVRVYRAKKGGGLASLLSAFLDADAAPLLQLLAAGAGHHQDPGTALSSLQQPCDPPGATLSDVSVSQEDAAARKISQESLIAKT